MKNYPSIFRIILCIALIFVLSLTELIYCFHSTLKSPTHFARLLEQDKKLSQFTLLVYDSLSEPADTNSSQVVINRFAVTTLNKLDQTWVKGQIYIGATGLHRYISSDAVSLPTFDFVPLNKAIKESLVSEIMKQPQTKAKVEKVKTVLSVLNNKYFSAAINFGLNNQLVSMLLELAPIRSTGFDRTTILEIIKTYLAFSNKSTTLDQASDNIVRQMASEALELNKLRDYFDMNLFLEKAFVEVNPIASLKTFLTKVDTSTTVLVQVLFCCLLLLLLINVNFNLVKLLKNTFYCTFAASSLNLLLSILLINPLYSNKLITAFANPQGSFGRFLVKVLVFLFRDFGLYLALQSVLLTIVAAVLYLIMKLLFKKAKNAKAIVHFPTWRLTAVIVIFTVVFVGWNLIAINSEIVAFHKDMDKIRSADINQSIVNGLIEAGGMDFLKYVQRK